MATRTRTEYLRDLATNHVTSTTLDSTSKLSKYTKVIKFVLKMKLETILYENGNIKFGIYAMGRHLFSGTNAETLISGTVFLSPFEFELMRMGCNNTSTALELLI